MSLILDLNKEKDYFRNSPFLYLLGAELEFYLHLSGDDKITIFMEKIQREMQNSIYMIEPEKGENQYEMKFRPSLDAVELSENLKKAVEFSKKIAQDLGGEAVFLAKPYKDKPGSALHIHINIFNSNEDNLFARVNEEESEYMLWAINGLIETLPETIKYFLPTKDSLNRLNDFFSPRVISWGGDNRTVMLRIPSSTQAEYSRRIEHRLAGSDSKPDEVIAAILYGIRWGVEKQELPKYNKVYGNAFESQYSMLSISSLYI